MNTIVTMSKNVIVKVQKKACTLVLHVANQVANYATTLFGMLTNTRTDFLKQLQASSDNGGIAKGPKSPEGG